MSHRKDGIKGVTGIEPVGAAITIGVKGNRGHPVQKDRFHIQEPNEGPDKSRRPHPSFGWFNDAAADKRRVIQGVVAHRDWASCLEQHYFAYRARFESLEDPRATPEGGRPFCSGDGEQATQWMGDCFRDVVCPAEKCVFRQRRVVQQTSRDRGRRVPSARPGHDCKPLTRFLFRVEWSEQLLARHNPPTPLVRFASGGWRTFRAIRGLRESLDTAAATLGEQMGLGGPVPYSPLGLRFSLLLTEKSGTIDGNPTRYPYIVVSPQQSAMDFVLSSYQQTQRVAQLGGTSPLAIADDSILDAQRVIDGPRGGA